MRPTRFVLTGGLGNQLFQFAAALSHRENTEVSTQLETLLGKPRGANDIPDLFRFDLTNTDGHNSWSLLINRALGFSLRQSLKLKTTKLDKIFLSLVKLMLSLIVSIRLFKTSVVKSPKDLGFDANFSIRQSNDLVIGYFQSYKLANENSETRKYLQSLRLVGDEPADLVKLREISLTEKPLVVHIRRGDYREEDSFGLLSKEYYFSIIPEILSTGGFNKIWLFSDDFASALECIPNNLRILVREIEEIDNSPAATLQAMRLGFGYVIANSSFSWWGANLSYQPNAQIHAPWPWFKGMKSPNELLPPQWISHPSKWE
jgi:hypothetical protein